MVQDKRPSTSEYRRSFKDSKFQCFTRNYEDCLDYRLLRRSAEHNHNVDVFTWDDPGLESSSSSDIACTTDCRPQSVPTHKFKHELFIKAYKEKNEKSPGIKVSTGGGQAVVAKSQKAQGTKSLGPESLKLDLPVSPREISKSKGTKVKHSGNGGMHLQTQQGRLVTKSQKEPVITKSPFVTYGSQDKELLVATKKTHNIKASAEIHPSAIRAMQRRKLQTDLLEEKTKSAHLNGRQKKTLYNDFDAQMDRETQAWDTEYRRHFLGYGKEIYSRSLSARFNPNRQPNMDRLLAATT